MLISTHPIVPQNNAFVLVCFTTIPHIYEQLNVEPLVLQGRANRQNLTCIFRSHPSSTMSWVHVAAESHFPIQNLPFGIFSTITKPSWPRPGVAIGDFVLDLNCLHNAGLLNDLGFPSSILTEPTLNSFMGLERKHWRATRTRLHDLLVVDGQDIRLSSNEVLRAKALVPMEYVVMHMPAQIGDYTDFYSSREHATNVGIMFRGKDNALQPNWLHLPVGYHGRASSVVVSGSDVVRPNGQLQADKDDPSKGSTYGPCRLLDYELEMAFFVGGKANPLGRPLTIAEAEDRIFGVVVMNDWSARDIQAWEYVPLGPFTAKNFATSISPWIVTLDALDGFRCETSAGPTQSEPEPLPYLRDPDYGRSSYNVRLEVRLVISSRFHATVPTSTTIATPCAGANPGPQ
jgi:fumarylacetoacetase